MADSKYTYPGTNILINKLYIRDNTKLSDIEREITSARLGEIKINPVKGDFDFKHLKAIHKSIFSDVYDWAGKPRTVDIAKSNLFSRAMLISDNADKLFSDIKRDDFLIGLPKNKAIEKLAYYMGEINALHPFREGNGRTQRLFISYLAMATGFALKFKNVNSENMLNASVHSMRTDNSKFEMMFHDIAEPITLVEQGDFIKAVSKSALKVFNDCDTLSDRTTELPAAAEIGTVENTTDNLATMKDYIKMINEERGNAENNIHTKYKEKNRND